MQYQELQHQLLNLVFKFNSSKVLLSDNGSEFNNKILQKICFEFQIKRGNVIAYYPASNGVMKGRNTKIFQNLRSMVGNVSTTWHEWMPQIPTSLNSSIQTTTGDTRQYIIFCPWQEPVLDFTTKVYNFDHYVHLKITVFQKTYTNAFKRT